MDEQEDLEGRTADISRYYRTWVMWSSLRCAAECCRTIYQKSFRNKFSLSLHSLLHAYHISHSTQALSILNETFLDGTKNILCSSVCVYSRCN